MGVGVTLAHSVQEKDRSATCAVPSTDSKAAKDDERERGWLKVVLPALLKFLKFTGKS